MREKIAALLREDLEKKLGKAIKYERDFVELSGDIFEKTTKQISISTLKRFFGTVTCHFKPSKFTLETLANYLGFDDIQAYLEGFDLTTQLHKNSWSQLKNRVNLITEVSLESLKLKTGYDPGIFVLRPWGEKYLESFYQSSKSATMVVAPDGFGKSTMLIQLVERILTDPTGKHKDDIVGLIDGGTFFNLYSRSSSIELLNQLLELKIETSLFLYFQKHPEQVNGCFWLIIDDVDEVFYDKLKQHQFIENLTKIILLHRENNWVKFIFTCRPENLNIFTGFIKKNPILENCWFEVEFDNNNMAECINIPLLNEKEIKFIFKNLGVKNGKPLKRLDNDLLDTIRHPNLLEVLVEEYDPNEELSIFLLLGRYLNKRINSQPYRNEKLQLVNRFFELCNLAKESNSVIKEQLVNNTTEMGYHELVSYGILYELTSPADFFNSNIYVRFSQNSIFDFLLFKKWLQHDLPDLERFKKIKEFYENNVQMQCRLLPLNVKLFLHNKDYQAILHIHQQLEKGMIVADDSSDTLPLCMISIAEVVKMALKNNPALRELFMPWIYSSRLGNTLYGKELFNPNETMV